MARPLPIRVAWTLLFTLTIAAVVVGPVGLVYVGIERQVYREGEYLVASLVKQLLHELEEDPSQPVQVAESFVAETQAVDPLGGTEIPVGVVILDRAGRVLASAGALAGRPPPLPVDAAARELAVSYLDLGRSSPFLAAAAAAPTGSVQLALYGRRYARSVDDVHDRIELLVPLALGVSALAAWWLAGRALRPIRRITATARRISADRLDERMPLRGSGDELDELSETLNELFARVRRSLEGLRGFSANAAHQLRSPLARLHGRIELGLESKELEPGARTLLVDLLGEVTRIAAAVDAMLRLTRAEGGLERERLSSVRLVELVESVVELFEPVAEEKGVGLKFFLEESDAVVWGELSWLREALSNLLDNAIRYTPAGGSIEVRALAAGPLAGVEVADTGPGIPPEAQERVFERFYRITSRPDGGSLGLGLALVQEIARAHGGHVELESRPGSGSRFRLWLPRGSTAPPAPELRSASGRGPVFTLP